VDKSKTGHGNVEETGVTDEEWALVEPLRRTVSWPVVVQFSVREASRWLTTLSKDL
jgi:hypothetical protein